MMFKANASEEQWAKLIEDFFKLGLKEATVPVYSLPYDTAKAISAKLKIGFEVQGTDYVFLKNGVSVLRKRIVSSA